MSLALPLKTSGTDWKQALGQALRTAQDLAREGFIGEEEVAAYDRLLAQYPLVLPRYYAALIDREDPRCPIRLQAIPRLEELEETPASDETGNFGDAQTPDPNHRKDLDHTRALKKDPLNDLKHRPAPRITHRYANRALIHLTPNCSMVCRYCFRKSLLSEKRSEFFEGDLKESIEYLRRTPALEEVIFSGGDPFLANENTLEETLRAISEMPHIKRVRFHSRVPVTLPMRITPEFVALLTKHGVPVVVVMHFNHPREVTEEAALALQHFSDAQVMLLNQSVLLAGVNDDAGVLKDLSEKLFDARVLPYYLHHPDRAQGTGHFDLSKERGLEIYHQLRETLAGYLVPRYVVDYPGIHFKQDVSVSVSEKII